MEQGTVSAVIAMGVVGMVGLITGLVVGTYHRSRTIKMLRRQIRTNRSNRIDNVLENTPDA
jgi:hypothetical protein